MPAWFMHQPSCGGTVPPSPNPFSRPRPLLYIARVVPTPSAAAETSWSAKPGRLRLDRFLVIRIPGWSRRHSHAAIAAGAVLVNRRRGRKGDMLRRGDVIDARLIRVHRRAGRRADLALPILYEDEAVVMVDKPAGMPAVALRPGDRGTVANALIGRCRSWRASGAHRSGLVHRLDTPTSGVLARRAPRTTGNGCAPSSAPGKWASVRRGGARIGCRGRSPRRSPTGRMMTGR
jgi:ribosomal protein L14